MEPRSSRGKIQYLGDTVGERGREWFHRTDYPNGIKVFRTISEMDDSQILRDVVFSLDADYRPLECYERLVVRGNLSMAWMKVERDHVQCEGSYSDLGRVSQRVDFSFQPSYLTAHPLVGDCLAPSGYDFAKGGRQTLHGISTSPMVNGSTGPIAALSSHGVEYFGWETVQTPIGPVEAHHFRVYYGPNEEKYQDSWSAADWSFVQVYNGELQTTYRLVELETWEGTGI
ncbi:MAG: hypothetical protein U0556_13435 [Dehalococcoidia bacterium]